LAKKKPKHWQRKKSDCLIEIESPSTVLKEDNPAKNSVLLLEASNQNHQQDRSKSNYMDVKERRNVSDKIIDIELTEIDKPATAAKRNFFSLELQLRTQDKRFKSTFQNQIKKERMVGSPPLPQSFAYLRRRKSPNSQSENIPTKVTYRSIITLSPNSPKEAFKRNGRSASKKNKTLQSTSNSKSKETKRYFSKLKSSLQYSESLFEDDVADDVTSRFKLKEIPPSPTFLDRSKQTIKTLYNNPKSIKFRKAVFPNFCGASRY